MKKIDLSIIIPVFNEEESIDILFSEIILSIDSQFNSEIIFINDGSKDASKDKIIKLVNGNTGILFGNISFFFHLIDIHSLSVFNP